MDTAQTRMIEQPWVDRDPGLEYRSCWDPHPRIYQNCLARRVIRLWLKLDSADETIGLLDSCRAEFSNGARLASRFESDVIVQPRHQREHHWRIHSEAVLILVPRDKRSRPKNILLGNIACRIEVSAGWQ